MDRSQLLLAITRHMDGGSPVALYAVAWLASDVDEAGLQRLLRAIHELEGEMAAPEALTVVEDEDQAAAPLTP